MVGSELLGNLTGVLRLVELYLRKPDGKGLERTRSSPSCRCHHGTGIQPAAQEGAERDIADKMRADGVFEEPSQAVYEVVFGLPMVWPELQVPVLLGAHGASRRSNQDIPRLELVDVLDDAFGGRSIKKCEEVVGCAPVDLTLDIGNLEQALQLGAEKQPAADLGEIERLDSQPIARQ